MGRVAPCHLDFFSLLCMEGDISNMMGPASGAESAKASEHEKEAGVGEQVSVETQRRFVKLRGGALF